MGLVIELGSKGFPTSFGRLLRSTQTPSAVETNAFPSRSRSSSGVVSGAIRQLAACARRLPRSTRTGNNEASNRKRRNRSSPTAARRKIGNLIRKQIEQLLPTMYIEFLIDMLHVACHRVFRKRPAHHEYMAANGLEPNSRALLSRASKAHLWRLCAQPFHRDSLPASTVLCPRPQKHEVPSRTLLNHPAKRVTRRRPWNLHHRGRPHSEDQFRPCFDQRAQAPWQPKRRISRQARSPINHNRLTL